MDGELIDIPTNKRDRERDGPGRPFVDYRDWLASVVLRSYSAAKASEEKLIRGLVTAEEASDKTQAREVLREVFAEQIANKKPGDSLQ